MRYIGVRYHFRNSIYEFTVDREMAEAACDGDVEVLALRHVLHAEYGACGGHCVRPVELFESGSRIEGRLIARGS